MHDIFIVFRCFDTIKLSERIQLLSVQIFERMHCKEYENTKTISINGNSTLNFSSFIEFSPLIN